MKISLKNIVVIILSGLILFSLAGCSANNNLKTPSPPAKAVKRAENQNKYVGKYNLVSIGSDESIKNNYDFFYIELKENNMIVQRGEPKNKKKVSVYYEGEYIIYENDNINITYANMEDYIQYGRIENGKIFLTDIIDGYEYIYELEK